MAFTECISVYDGLCHYNSVGRSRRVKAESFVVEGTEERTGMEDELDLFQGCDIVGSSECWRNFFPEKSELIWTAEDLSQEVVRDVLCICDQPAQELVCFKAGSISTYA